jgi:tetratricopeptide (TPR) repeat protein
MHSNQVDETRPTSTSPHVQSLQGETPIDVSTSSRQVTNIDVTQPMAVKQTNELSINETQPTQIGDSGYFIPPERPDQPAGGRKSRYGWILWALLGVFLLALIAGGSVYAGYNSAINQRTRYQSTLVAGEASNQYILAQQDIALGNYDLARQRLEYIIKIDPNFPDVSEQLAFVLTQQRITATPTVMPTPTLTPTPDYRGRDELFSQAQNQLVARDWSGTIDTLLLLRKNYPDFMAVKVDGMLFVALRNRGIDKIALLHDLEGGNYDLTLAERFGPLDAEARNWRDWAELYIRGASFWGVDWAQSISYFAQLAAAAPNLSDVAGWTASNRYLEALLGYGDWLAARGQWCDAQTQYDTYMTLLASPQVEPTAVFAADQCAQSLAPEVTPGGEVTSTPETPLPTDTPQPETTPYP